MFFIILWNFYCSIVKFLRTNKWHICPWFCNRTQRRGKCIVWMLFQFVVSDFTLYLRYPSTTQWRSTNGKPIAGEIYRFPSYNLWRFSLTHSVGFGPHVSGLNSEFFRPLTSQITERKKHISFEVWFSLEP